MWEEGVLHGSYNEKPRCSAMNAQVDTGGKKEQGGLTGSQPCLEQHGIQKMLELAHWLG